MFERFKNWVKQVISKLIGKSDIKAKLHIDVAVSGDMSQAMELWVQMYQNKAPWLSDDVKSANLAAAVAGEIARMVTIELKTEITGSARADYLNSQYKKLLERLREYCEYGCAKGGLTFKPYISGDNIAVDAVHADCFFPTKYNSAGVITGAVFVERLTKGGAYYTRLEMHDLSGTVYEVTNKAYRSLGADTLGTEVSLESVEEWSEIEPYARILNIKQPLFAYFKIPLANTIDYGSPLGVSVFSRGTEQIEEADKQYSRLLWEMEGGELAIDADETLFHKNNDGKPILPKGKKRLFRTMMMDETREQMKVFSPELRDQSLINTYNRLLQMIEFNCGLAYGTLSDPQSVDKTATEVIAAKQRSYALVSDIQKSLQTALEQLVYAMDVWATLGKLAPAGAYETSFEWDDSIIVDAEAERQMRLQEVQSGIRSAESYLSWCYGITEEEAQKLMPKMKELTD